MGYLVLLFFLSCSLGLNSVKEEDGVLVLNDSNFDQILNDYPQILVEFYAPWCKFCQKFAPMYSKAAERLMKEDSSIRIAKIDATENIETALKYNIEGYPTLKFFTNSKPSEYTGNKNEQGIYNWLLKKMGPSTKELDSKNSLEVFMSTNDVSIVLFSTDPDLTKTYEKIAKNSEGNIYFTCKDPTKWGDFNINSMSLAVFKGKDLVIEEFKGNFIENEISKFIERSLLPWLIPFDEKAIQIVFGKQNPCLFIFRKDSDDIKYSSALEILSKKLKGSPMISFADLSNPSNRRLVEYLGFTANWMPFALIVNQKSQKFIYRNEITEESLYNFVERWRKGIEKPYLKSQPLPNNPYSDGMTTIVGENFAEVVFDKKFDVFVEFFAPWCSHCKKLAPEYTKVARAFKGVDTVVVAKIDATENEVEGFDIQEFPTLKFFPANNKDGIDYKGPKDAKSIEEFIRTNAALPMKREEL